MSGNVKTEYDRVKNKFLNIEKDLIYFLKNAHGEQMDSVIDMIKAAYDPSDESSILTVAYIIELDALPMFIPDIEMRKSFIAQNSNRLYEATVLKDYYSLVSSGAMPSNPRVESYLSEFESNKTKYQKTAGIQYMPMSLNLMKITNQIRDMKRELHDADIDYYGRMRNFKEINYGRFVYYAVKLIGFATLGVWLLTGKLNGEWYVWQLEIAEWAIVIINAICGLIYLVLPLRFRYGKKITKFEWRLTNIKDHMLRLSIIDIALAVFWIVLYRSWYGPMRNW